MDNSFRLLQPVLCLIWIRGITEPRWVQALEVMMQLACTASISSTLCSLRKCTGLAGDPTSLEETVESYSE
ncbi:hypothetical protein Taro_053994 [Colocasia esculenta]|uniref:Uncharacterized protein n=1 Tax=Colocasia esculenta TaxID=4460 RepID=A0A843XMK5_COLES|nr:hypothetical protein [Colocasia esculenta]